MDVGAWLRSLGLDRYEAAFRENEIDGTVLPNLTADDLKDLGVSIVGHRRKLLDAIAALSVDANARARSVGSAVPITDSPAKDTAERRQVTVMFSDLVGSTALAARLDPEDLREVIAIYHKCTAESVRRFGGFVSQYLGDGVLVYFGYPHAHEDDAERAVRAGLELIAAVGGLNTSVPLQARVGIATGVVVVGDIVDAGGSQERSIIGETPNLAARLQGLAEPNMVVIAESTRKLLGNLFELEDLGVRELKGMAGPVRAWAALQASSVHSRFEALHATGLTALVGREEEFELLLRRWSRAKSGQGQVVLLSGEAGIGKSRLTVALLERLASEPHTRLRYFCSPQHIDSALYPIIGQMERAAGLTRDDTTQAKLDKLAAVLAQTSTPIQDTALFAEMLSLPNDGRYPTSELTSQQRRQKTMEALIAQLETLARQNPVLIIFEDAHWTDPTSLEVFGRTVDRVRGLRVLLIVTLRPEFEPPWIGQPHVTTLTINRLTEHEVGAIIDRMVGNKLLPASIRQDIIERTDGIPLFVEEMTKAVLEAESEGAAERAVVAVPSPAVAVPASLHASLMARLDRLGPAKEVAQIGAAIGREFSHAVLAAVVRRPEAEMGSGLDRLIAAGLLFRQGVPPHATYLFKHALVRDAAYGSLLRNQRQQLHGLIAAVIETQFPEVVETQPELVARHFGEAGLTEKAIGYWLQAGRLAAARSANVEAIAHLRAGLASINDLPSSLRPQWELALQLALGGPLLATKGFASSEVETAYRRAQSLSKELDHDTDLFTALRGLGYVHHVRGDLRQSMREFPEAIDLARRIGEPAQLMQAYHFAGVSTFHLGAFQAARDWLQRSLEAAGSRASYHSEVYGINMGVFCQVYIGHCDWHLGYPDCALNSAEEALSVARQVSHPFSIVLALAYLAMLHQFRREPEAALKAAAEARGLCQEYRFDYYGAWSALVRAWAIAEQGQTEEGASAYDAALQEFSGTGAGLRMPHYLCLLAGIHRKAGQRAAGFKLLAEANRIAERNHETWCSAKLELERGELLLGASEDAGREADTAFRHAIDIAAGQGAKMLELRASVVRARHWAERGERQKAFDMLSPIYGWFSQGFKTPDLLQAKTLLGELR